MKMGRIQRDEMQMPRSPHLPQELIEEILSWVAVKPLMRFTCASKKLCTLITTDMPFQQKHLCRRATIDQNGFILRMIFYKPTRSEELHYAPNEEFMKGIKLETFSRLAVYSDLVGSSNGLVCLGHYPYSKKYGKAISLWNPAIRQHKTIPHPQIEIPQYGHAALGFGCDSIANDYKVVRLVFFHDFESKGFHVRIEVYSLAKDTWTVVGDYPYNSHSPESSRAVVNGVAHWMACYGVSETSGKFIMSFNMTDHLVGEVPIPETFNSSQRGHICLRLFKGSLSICDVIFQEKVDVWVMREYGVKQSWTKLFYIQDQSLCYSPVCFMRDGKILFSRPLTITSYNAESGKIVDYRFIERLLIQQDAIPYVESLVQLGTSNQVV